MAEDARGLELELERELGEAREEFERRLVEISFEALAGIVERTPVDTGFARNSWQVEIGEARGETEPPGLSAGDPTSRAQSTIQRAKLGDVVTISNNARYIRQLEDGRSDQAANGMVSVTLAELRSRLRR